MGLTAQADLANGPREHQGPNRINCRTQRHSAAVVRDGSTDRWLESTGDCLRGSSFPGSKWPRVKLLVCRETEVNSVRYQLALSAENMPSGEWDQFDGVGLVRGEYILRNAGVYVTLPEGRERIRSYLDRICAMFYPRPVWYRFLELEAAEASVLAGIDVELPTGRNPMVGTRGVRRSVGFP